MWERQRKGWGIRNVKLRFSRKLLFIWGLLASFSGELFSTDQVRATTDEDEYYRLLAQLIGQQTDVSPLDLLARVVREVGDVAIADDIFSSYNHFLATLADPAARASLESVQFDGAPDDPTYTELREASRRFRNGVTSLFFDEHPHLRNLIREYGVF
jgi:hypothetical protein